MLLNLSYKDPVVNDKLIAQVGKGFSLKERIKLKGIGSGRYVVVAASPNIQNLLLLDTNVNWCQIEMRPKGLVVRFRKLLDTYGFVIPYHKLSIFKTDRGYTLHKDQQFATLQAQNEEGLKSFMDKVMIYKALHLTNRPD